MKHAVKIRVNGQDRNAEVESRLLLVHFLRDVLALTGTHIGCDTTQCGAFTISLDGQAVKSCTIFTVQANNADIVTIEGLAANGKLHPIQEAFRAHHGLQCGFCTPGMIMAAKQLLERYPDPTPEEIRHQLDGNICRCTGYHGIVKAIEAAADAMAGKPISRHAATAAS